MPLSADLANWNPQVYRLINAVYSEGQLPAPDDGRENRVNPLNANFHKKEFQELWGRINREAAYTVHFDTAELVAKAPAALNAELLSTEGSSE